MKSIHDWFQEKKEQKEIEKKSEKLDIPGNLWVKCYKCGQPIYAKDLADNLKILKTKYPSTPEVWHLAAALAAYNCGLGNVFHVIRNKQDLDHRTAGQDYSRDVLARKDWLEKNGF